MGFFNPGFLWFAMGGSIPVIIHLLHRQKYKRTRWAAMEFLLAALRKTQKRLRLENLLLLLIRILILMLLALAIARPFFREAPIDVLADTNTHHIIVIDTSASMGYRKAQETCLEAAKKAASRKLDEIRKLTEQDKISVVLMSAFPEVFVAESNKRPEVQRRLGEIRLSHYGTSVYATLHKISDLLDKSQAYQQKQISIFTDFQRNSWEAADDAEGRKFAELTRQLSARPGVVVQLVDVGSEGAENRGVVELRVDRPVISVKQPVVFTAQVHNWSATPYPSVAVKLHVDGSQVKADSCVLPANGGASIPFHYEFVEPGPHFISVATDPDFLDCDDRRYLSVDVRAGISCLLVDGEPDTRPFESETDFLRTVLDRSGEGRDFKPTIVTAEMFDGERMERYDFVALCNVQSLSQEKVEKLERFVRGGGGLLVTLGARVDKQWYNEALFRDGKGLLPAALTELTGSPAGQEPVPQHIREYRTQHHLFWVYRDKLRQAPRQLIFYQYYRLEKYDPAGVIADFDDPFQTPLWLESACGDGRVLLYNNTADDGWNLGVVAKPPFPTMMRCAAEYLAMRPAARNNLIIGDFISLQMTADRYQKAFNLDTPEGVITLSPETPKPDSQSFWIRYPSPPPDRKPNDPRPMENEGVRFVGQYVLDKQNKKDDDPPIAAFAVNFPPRNPSAEELHRSEGNLERIDEEEIRRRLPDFRFEIIGKKTAAQDVNLAAPAAGLWKHLLYLVLGLLATESVLAWVFGRGKQ